MKAVPSRLPAERRLLRAVVAALLLAGLALRSGVAADSLAVTDGDGFRLNGERIRLWGIDAPELGQTCERGALPYPCGEEAREVLGVLLQGGAVVECQALDQDRYERTAARCAVNGRDLGGELVRLGWAVDFRRYSKGAYAGIEEEARKARRACGRENPSCPPSGERSTSEWLPPPRPSCRALPCLSMAMFSRAAAFVALS